MLLPHRERFLGSSFGADPEFGPFFRNPQMQNRASFWGLLWSEPIQFRMKHLERWRYFFSIPTSVDECGVVVSSYHLVRYSTVKAKIDCFCIFQTDIYIYIYV